MMTLTDLSAAQARAGRSAKSSEGAAGGQRIRSPLAHSRATVRRGDPVGFGCHGDRAGGAVVFDKATHACNTKSDDRIPAIATNSADSLSQNNWRFCVNHSRRFSPRKRSKRGATGCPEATPRLSLGPQSVREQGESRRQERWISATSRNSARKVRIAPCGARERQLLSRPARCSVSPGEWLPRGLATRTLRGRGSENQVLSRSVRAAGPDPSRNYEQFWCASRAELTQQRAAPRLRPRCRRGNRFGEAWLKR